jgi:flagellar motor switch/type III secretory pathway protein FliN
MAEERREAPAGVLRGEDAAAAIAEAERQQYAKSVESLPSYSRSLLKVRVPVTVTLARKKQRISQIVELGPGSIIQFSKSCDQLLELEVNGRTIGEGEAVKVGEKFGLRVTGMVLPGEKFLPVQATRTA